MKCEDFPCCGHENGCCPSYDESGRQLDMVCVCGARLPVDNPVSICLTWNSRTSSSRLYEIIQERLDLFSYEDLTKIQQSGMTRMQEFLGENGIKESNRTEEGYVSVMHPESWTRKKTSGQDFNVLLIPNELAIKITTLGHIP